MQKREVSFPFCVDVNGSTRKEGTVGKMDMLLALGAVAWKRASCFISKSSNLQNRVVLAVHVFRRNDGF